MDFHEKNILLVDDDASNLLTLETILKEEGYHHLLSASCAAQAYEILESNNIDLILLDIMMPEVDGLQACKVIRSNPHYGKTPIIIVTADSSNEALKNSFEAGANDYITKPINSTNLTVRVRSVLMDRFKDTLILSHARQLAVNETIQMLAHQWRQPLTAISSRVLNLKLSFNLDSFDLSTEEGRTAQQEYFDSGLDEINADVTKLTNSITEFRNISSNQLKSTRGTINEALYKSINFIQDRCINNDIKVETKIEENSNMILFSNELVKVLLSIYNNSIEAFKRRNIEHDRVLKIASNIGSKYTQITITDNAGGIKADILPKVFNPYFSTKENLNLIGLGLYNASTILKEFMDASISIASQADQTIVTIKIPR